MIKAVIFDLDGTLLDRAASLATFVQTQCRDLASRLAPASPDAFIRRFIELDDHGRVWKDEVYQTLIREFGITQIGWTELLDDYVTTFHRHCQPFPGMAAALASLAASGYKLAIITNGRYPFQLQSAEALGILPLLEFVMVSEQEGIRKPDPAIFHRATARLQVGASEAVYVGDHPANDVRAARDAGLRTIWRPSAHFGACADADAVCDDMRLLADVVRGLDA